MSEYFPKPSFLGTNVKVELDFFNYAIKTDLKMQQLLIHNLLLKQLIQPIKNLMQMNQMNLNIRTNLSKFEK